MDLSSGVRRYSVGHANAARLGVLIAGSMPSCDALQATVFYVFIGNGRDRFAPNQCICKILRTIIVHDADDCTDL
jgi:hypothetical protein